MYWVVSIILLASACQPSRVQVEKKAVAVEGSTFAPEIRSAPPIGPRRISPSKLQELGYDTTDIDGGLVRACPAGGRRSHCLCVQTLDDCDPDKCLRFTSHVENFRRELRGVDGRVVYCDLAEIGTCGDYLYFHFEEMHRTQTLWFAADERLIAIQEWTDYRAYCNRTTLRLFQGELPACDKLTRTELLCGKGEVGYPPEAALRGLARAR